MFTSATRVAQGCGRLAALGLLLTVTYGGTCSVSASHHHEHCNGSHHHAGCHHHSTQEVTAEPGLLLERTERSSSVDANGERVEVVRVFDGPGLSVRSLADDRQRHGFALGLIASNASAFATDPAGALAPRGVIESGGRFLAYWVRESGSEGGDARELPGYRLRLAFDSEGRLVEIERRLGLTGLAADLVR